MVIKKFNRSESAQKFIHVGIDVKFMHTNFGGHALFGFGDIATFKNGQFSLFIKKFNRSQSAQKIYLNKVISIISSKLASKNLLNGTNK